MAVHNFYLAQLECEKIIYLSDDNLLTAKVLLLKSNCYKQLDDFKSASKTLSRVNFYNLPDSIHYSIRYESALCSYLIQEFEFAEHQIDLMNNYIKDTSLVNQSLLLQVLVFNETKKWKNAHQTALKFVHLSELSDQEKDSIIYYIDMYYSQPPKIKSPHKAQKYSTFFPGLGQIYTGNTAEGVLNFTLHLFSLGVAGISFYYKYYLTGYFGGLALLQRFYYGGINRAEHLANKYNHEKCRSFNDSIKNVLLKTEAFYSIP